MDVLDQALDSSNVTIYNEKDVEGVQIEESNGNLSVENVQYQIRAETGALGQVTYRVVQINNGEEEASQVIEAGATFTEDSAGNILTGSFQEDQSPTQITTTDDRGFTYINANSLTNAADAQNIAQSAESIGQTLQQIQGQDGPYYVMVPSQEVINQSNATQRMIAPRIANSRGQGIDGVRTSRDDRRRATHNEVERRRRDKINNWIVQLSKLIPDCTLDLSKQGQLSKSKGGILAKACDYISELRKVNTNLVESVKASQKESELLLMENKILNSQLEELKHDKSILTHTIDQHGLLSNELTH